MTKPVTTFAERLAAKRKELARAERVYYEACTYRDGGDSLAALGVLTEAILEVGRLEDIVQRHRGRLGAMCEPQLPLATTGARRA